jgi:hypothetical protein
MPALIIVLVSLPVFSSGPAINFINADSAAAAVLPPLPEPCVSRLPTWKLSVGEGTYNRFSARNSHTDCREAFGASVRNFTEGDKDLITHYVAAVDSVISDNFPVLHSIPWSFVVISDTTDFGVPNSNEHIILTKGLLDNMTEWADRQSSSFFVGMEIFIREKVRLLQLRQPEPFEKFYASAWGFRRIPALSIDRIMQDNGLFFTRVPANEWVIKVSPRDREHILPALLLRDAGKDAGGTVQRVAVVIDSTSRGFFPRKSKRLPIEYRDLRQVPNYRKKFPLSEYDYHPAELSADLIAKFLVMNYVSGRFGTAAARTADYSQIDVLMGMVSEAGE